MVPRLKISAGAATPGMQQWAGTRLCRVGWGRVRACVREHSSISCAVPTRSSKECRVLTFFFFFPTMGNLGSLVKSGSLLRCFQCKNIRIKETNYIKLEKI